MNPEDINWQEAFREELKSVITPNTSWTWILLEDLDPMIEISSIHCRENWYQDKFFFLSNKDKIKSVSFDGEVKVCWDSRCQPESDPDGKVYYAD